MTQKLKPTKLLTPGWLFWIDISSGNNVCTPKSLCCSWKTNTNFQTFFFFLTGIFRSAQGRKITAEIPLCPLLSCLFPLRWRLHYVNERDMKKMALIVALLNYVVFVLTSLMLCYYNYKDLIFKRPEQLFEISNNAASRLECCTNIKTKQNCIT